MGAQSGTKAALKVIERRKGKEEGVSAGLAHLVDKDGRDHVADLFFFEPGRLNIISGDASMAGAQRKG